MKAVWECYIRHVIDDEILNPLGIFKEGTKPIMLVARMNTITDTEQRTVRRFG